MTFISGLRKTITLVLIILIGFAQTAQANNRFVSDTDFVSGTKQNLSLFIFNNDLEVDLNRQSAKLRMLIDAQDLMANDFYPQSFRIRTYSFGVGGEQMIHSDMSHTVKRRNRTRVKFSVELGYVEGDKDYYFEAYDSAGRLVNTYKQTIDFSNFENQEADLTQIAAADCDNSSFDECQLDYIMNKVNFLLEPKNTNFSSKVKKANGTYDVVISVPRAVREQIIRGNFDISALANDNNSGNGSSLSNGDNLGNHIATIDLDMNNKNIAGANMVSAAKFNGSQLKISGTTTLAGGLTISHGQLTNGYVLTSDNFGQASWQPAQSSNGSIGDNLGNHSATSSLDMNNFNISDANFVFAKGISAANGTFANTVTLLNGLKIGTGAVTGYVLTSDVNGNASWQAASGGGGGNGDNLGNHLATMDLTMNGNSISNVDNLNVLGEAVFTGTKVAITNSHLDVNNTLITLNGIIQIPGTNPATGHVLTSDANGRASWLAPSGGGGNGDNLGDHLATMNLNLNGNSISNVDNLNVLGDAYFDASDVAIANGQFSVTNSVITLEGPLFIPNSPVAGYVLTSDANGRAFWMAPSGGGGNGDNLGDHVATMTLNLANNNIDNGNHIQSHSAELDSLSFHVNTTNVINGGALTLDLEEYNKQYIVLDQNVTFTFIDPNKNKDISLVLVQDGTGNRVVSAWPGNVKWPGGFAPTISNGASTASIIECLYLQIPDEYLCDLRATDYQ